MRRDTVATVAAALLLAACPQSSTETPADEAADGSSEPVTSETAEAAGDVAIPPEAEEYCAIVLGDPLFDEPPETPEEFEEQFTAFVENDRRLVAAAPPEIAEDVEAIAADFAAHVEDLKANGWSTEGFDDVEIWDQEQVDRVHVYDLRTCGVPERP